MLQGKGNGDIMGQEGTAPRRASETLPSDIRELLPADFAETVDFHGHLCPGLTIGYRAATIAMNRLGIERGADEELVGIVETDACGVDAFQYLTGCTMGKGNFIYRDYGKQAFTVVRRSDGRGIRVAMRHDAFPVDRSFTSAAMRGFSENASETDRALAQRRHHERAMELLGLDDDTFAEIAEVEVTLPEKARLFPSIICSVCGEPVMEARMRVRDGEPCCIPCSISYGRGWEING